MSTTKTPSRVNSFANNTDLSDFQPKTTPAPKPSKEDIEQIAKETGFVSRQPQVAQIARTRRYTTGRNQQLNLKVTEDTAKRFYAIADELGLPLGEVFHRAVIALENQRK